MTTPLGRFLLATLACWIPKLALGQVHFHGAGHHHHHGPLPPRPPFVPVYPVPILVPFAGMPFYPGGASWSPAFLPPPAGPIPAIPAPPEGDPPVPSKQVPRAMRTDTAQAAKLVKMGDNLFRAGNLNRARERYQQASRADASAAVPRLRLAEVAMVNGKYAEAANGLREAEAAEPGWLNHARDIQPLFGDPADFAAQISKVETYLQAHPEDRDAWMILGINKLLTGKAQDAADIFLSIGDEPLDPALSAFLAASRRKLR